ncbi:hypothetical protein [Haloarchaeobius sp. HME9146]|uniref:hypothetical protein n=1 Tax=Haloarchaeobius sp. HME9146 TaxID=2978732 RepID=UPI0021BE805E|nr:hypothetical protein [Haloarchaeobius sp. HME9146]MCT9097377.1 hypothetical protein [Haloarchaeobius sp. HME9146]
MDRRILTLLAGVLASLVITAALWWYFETLAVFLFLPFVPFLFRRGDGSREPEGRTCPRCGFRTTDPGYEYCPRDGEPLE